jgi:hypothetical protein
VAFKDSIVTFEPKSTSQSFMFNVTVSDGNGGTVKDSMVIVVSIPTGNLRNLISSDNHFSILRNGSGELYLQLHCNSATATASVYNLCGRKVGEFKKVGDHFILDGYNSSSNGTIFLLVVDLFSGTGKSRIIQKVILQ